MGTSPSVKYRQILSHTREHNINEIRVPAYRTQASNSS